MAPRLPDPGRFHADRPTNLRALPRHDHLAYVVRRLDATIEAMIPMLGVGEGDRVLDFGCAGSPYRACLPPEVEYAGADLPGNDEAEIEVAADGTLPVPDGSFDAVMSTQVLEHVEDPGVHLAESFRVLRSGGRLLLSTHGTMVFHPDPVDLWRWTAQGLERALVGVGFEVERLEGVLGLAATGLYMLQDGVLMRVPVRIHRPLGLLFQSLIALADRLSRPADRRMNALVYVLVARKPAAGVNGA